jgi:RHS repeat-associated protein
MTAFSLSMRMLETSPRTDERSGKALGCLHQRHPLGRRIEKSGAGVTTTYFLSDGADEIAEYDRNKALTARYVPGPAIDEPVAVVTGNAAPYTHHYFHANRQGSVIAMSDDSGAKVEGPYVYDPCGNGAPTTGEPYKLTGRRLDPETGLYYYRARYFWPQGCRFLQTDPVGYSADLNLYTYVGNDPTDRTDPSGLASYLVAREIWQGSGLFHMFVVVTPSLGAPPTARFSYGPSVDISLFPPAGPGSLVEQRGSGSITDIGDTGAYRDFANGRAGDGPAVFGARINASDAAVIKSGNAIDAKLGDRANPTGAVEYLVAPNAISAVVNPNAANSNSAAMAVANGALGNGQQQPLPKGVSAPGWGQSRIVTNAQSHNNVPDFSHGHCPAAQPGLSCGGGGGLDIWGQ